MSARVLLSGFYGFGNAGDEAVCAAILQTLRTHGGSPDVTVLSGGVELTQRLHGMYGVRGVPRRALLEVLPESDALFQGGGSLLQDATSARSVFYYLWVILAARIIHRPVFLYAQGIGPLHRKTTRAAVRTVLNRVQGISVRDRDSRALLTEIGVKVPPVYLTADPVWALEPAPDDRAALIWDGRASPQAAGPWPSRRVRGPALQTSPKRWPGQRRCSRNGDSSRSSFRCSARTTKPSRRRSGNRCPARPRCSRASTLRPT